MGSQDDYKITLRLSKDVADAVKQQAETENVSISEYIRLALRDRFGSNIMGDQVERLTREKEELTSQLVQALKNSAVASKSYQQDMADNELNEKAFILFKRDCKVAIDDIQKLADKLDKIYYNESSDDNIDVNFSISKEFVSNMYNLMANAMYGDIGDYKTEDDFMSDFEASPLPMFILFMQFLLEDYGRDSMCNIINQYIKRVDNIKQISELKRDIRELDDIDIDEELHPFIKYMRKLQKNDRYSDLEFEDYYAKKFNEDFTIFDAINELQTKFDLSDKEVDDLMAPMSIAQRIRFLANDPEEKFTREQLLAFIEISKSTSVVDETEEEAERERKILSRLIDLNRSKNHLNGDHERTAIEEMKSELIKELM